MGVLCALCWSSISPSSTATSGVTSAAPFVNNAEFSFGFGTSNGSDSGASASATATPYATGGGNNYILYGIIAATVIAVALIFKK